MDEERFFAENRRPFSFFVAGRNALGAVQSAMVAERDRWALWVPVAFGFGISVYFLLPFEPNRSHLFILLSIAIALAVTGERLRHIQTLAAALILVAILAGTVLISFRSDYVAAPRIDGTVTLSGLSGVVTSVEAFAEGPRIQLEDLTAANAWRAGENLPRSVRVRLRRGQDVPLVGQRISLTARLSEPPRPSMPGAYDFARRAWFQSLGGVGFAFTEWRPVVNEADNIGFHRHLEFGIARTRHHISSEIRTSLQGNAGAVASALFSGDRAPVPETVLEDLRRSGLAHLLAISGLHVGMVALIVFFAVRGVLAWKSGWALDRPIKKWAAAAALLATFGYLLLSGATVPTQRAFLMTGVVLLAVLLDRQAISMRLVAIAAMVVLIVQPESVTGASFQMSFAAVVALVAFYEAMPVAALRRGGGQDGRGRLSRTFWYAAAVCLTTLIAGAATAPFALHHFGQIAHYSVLANLIAIPIVTFWVMPLGLLSLLVLPVGLHDFPLYLAGMGIDAVLFIARFVADLPGAVGRFPALTDWGFAMVVGGGLWTAIWRRRWRYLGVLPVAGGLLSIHFHEPPVLILHESGNQAAVLWQDEFWVESTRRERFSLDVWGQRTGRPIAGDIQSLRNQRNSPVRCDPLGCLVTLPGDATGGAPVRIAFAYDPRALHADCGLADVTRAPVVPHPGLCQDRLIISPADLARNGAHAITIGPNGPELHTVEDGRRNRPWSRYGS